MYGLPMTGCGCSRRFAFRLGLTVGGVWRSFVEVAGFWSSGGCEPNTSGCLGLFSCSYSEVVGA